MPIMYPRHLSPWGVGVGDSFWTNYMDVSNDVCLSGRTRASRSYSGRGVHMFFTESLILAQDERWRRA